MHSRQRRIFPYPHARTSQGGESEHSPRARARRALRAVSRARWRLPLVARMCAVLHGARHTRTARMSACAAKPRGGESEGCARRAAGGPGARARAGTGAGMGGGGAAAATRSGSAPSSGGGGRAPMRCPVCADRWRAGGKGGCEGV
jgi:hypothetical protein